MSIVVDLWAKRDRVLISNGLVSEFTVTTSEGDQKVVYPEPVMLFFVAIHEASGGQLCLSSSRSYARAAEDARAASQDWENCPIVDLVPAGMRVPGRQVVIDYGYLEGFERLDPIYLVEVADGIDDAEQVWDGDTYDEAKRVASAIAADRGGLPIIDKVTA
jgi:hypothetical protein